MFTDPAAAVSGGTGYAFALPDAPGVSTRGSIGADQYQDYMHAAEDTDSGGVPAQRAIARGIRDTEAHGTASLPVRPAALPLTNAPVGQTPGSSSGGPRPPMATEMGQAGAAAAARLVYGPMQDRRSSLSRALRDQTTQERHEMDYLRGVSSRRPAANRPSYVIGPPTHAR